MAYADYWIKRADARMAEAHAGSDKVVQDIVAAYDAAISDLNRDIDKLFFRFAGKNGLSEDDAKTLLNQKLSVSEVESIREKINLIEDDEIRSKLVSKLESGGYRARISRLEALKEDIYIQTSRMADAELEISTSRYLDVIQDTYLRNVFDCQQYLGYAYSFNRMPERVVREILADNWSGKHYSRRIWENAQITSGRIEDTVKHLLIKGTMTGANSRRLAKELQGITGQAAYACERLVRTETTYFVAMADLIAARNRGTKKLQFVATLDSRTSEQCRENDGAIVPIEDAVPGKTIPPLHPYCRSVVIDVIEGLQHFVRRAKDQVTGKNCLVPADMTYSEWNNRYVKSGILLTPYVQNTMVQQSLKDFETVLDENDDGSNVFQMMRICKDNASYKENNNLSSAYAYDVKTDEFVYNPLNKHFADYDMNYVYAHELAHRLDATWCHSWENKSFLSAIEATKKKLYNNFAKVEAWLNGEAGKNAGFSDIIDALSNGRLCGVASHGEEYWKEDEMNAPMEIFANLVYIKTVKPSEVQETESFLEELFRALEELI